LDLLSASAQVLRQVRARREGWRAQTMAQPILCRNACPTRQPQMVRNRSAICRPGL
jgi:hypothetical protein